jgi:hypothetical protein
MVSKNLLAFRYAKRYRKIIDTYNMIFPPYVFDSIYKKEGRAKPEFTFRPALWIEQWNLYTIN